jgi:hypothetical protein
VLSLIPFKDVLNIEVIWLAVGFVGNINRKDVVAERQWA